MLVLHMVEQKALALPSFVVVLLVIIVSSQRVSLIARERRMLQFGDPDPLSAFSRKGYFSPKAY